MNLVATVPQEIIDAFEPFNITVEVERSKTDDLACAWFVVKGQHWTYRINTLAGLADYLAGFKRCIAMIGDDNA